jgi:hypothetical protein
LVAEAMVSLVQAGLAEDEDIEVLTKKQIGKLARADLSVF